jgi:ribosomal protein S21
VSAVVDVKKKKGERFDSLLRRFNKRVIESGKVLQARKIRFHERNQNKRRVKERALRRLEIVDKREWLRKTGQLPEEMKRDGRRRQ